MSDMTQARIAENQSTFRAANESIEDKAGDLGLEGSASVPFICECPQPECTVVIRLDVASYQRVRRHPRLFFNAPGHEEISVTSGAGTVLERHERYVVVEKIGIAGELAEELWAAEHHG